MIKKKRALFLDRDGVLNKLKINRPPWKIDEIEIYPESKTIIEIAKKNKYVPIVVTNQPDAERGNLSFENLYEIDTGGELFCETSEGTQIKLKGGIGYEYSNNVKVFSGKSCFDFPMFFSKPENHISKYYIKESKKINSYEIGNYDHFNNMYKDIIINNMNFDYQSYDNLKSRYDFIGKLLND